jgi:hypothetical protein
MFITGKWSQELLKKVLNFMAIAITKSYPVISSRKGDSKRMIDYDQHRLTTCA